MKQILFFTLPLFFLFGCAQNRDKDALTVQIRSKQNTNHGTPLYLVVKQTTMAEFLMEDYHNIATQSFWKEQNPENLVKKFIIPGSTKKLEIPLENKDKSVGLYFIFTNPGECWKYLVDDPQSKRVKVLLGRNEYKEINVYEP